MAKKKTQKKNEKNRMIKLKVMIKLRKEKIEK